MKWHRSAAAAGSCPRGDQRPRARPRLALRGREIRKLDQLIGFRTDLADCDLSLRSTLG